MNILHLCPFLQGGAGSVITTLATAQRAAGHHVTVVTSASDVPGYGNYPHHLDALRSAGVDLRLLDSLFRRDLADNLAVVHALLESGMARTDLVHAHAAVPGLIGLVLAGRAATHVPVVQTMHGWGSNKTTEQARHDVAVLNTVDRVVVPAEATRHDLIARGVGDAHICVVPYGVSPRDDVGSATSLELDVAAWRRRAGYVVCCVGTLGARKNQQLLIEALTHVRSPEQVLCVLVGDGDADGLQQQVQHAAPRAAIRIAGYRADARRIAAAADALVLPSRGEGQPLAILEAFCDGLPVVASAITELAELLEDGTTGWLFPPDDAQALAVTLDAVRFASAAGRHARVVAAHRRWAARHTVNRMLSGYAAVYRDECVALD